MLSGGQKQRVGIARALAAEPEIILFDEALSHLDLTLQEQLIGELKELHRRTQTTILYVTHNREEALALADRITLIHNGEIEQSGSVEEVFERPATDFAASFMGKGSRKREIWVYVQCEKKVVKQEFVQRRLISEKTI
jgi:ABC-type Fe3+/spermidine/putrescine transport system ATPase subunit